jgi:glycosyltransferase involved in cell wall biosynthesis
MHVGLDLLFLIAGESGGRETYARELISAMFTREPGLRATAFVSRDAGVEAHELPEGVGLVRLPVSTRRVEQWAFGEFAMLPAAAARAGVDVLHSLANFGPVVSGTRRVLTVHDLQYRALPDLMPASRRIGTAAMMGLAVRRAHRIIAVSHFARDELVRELSVAPQRIEVITNGLGTRPAGPPTDAARVRDRLKLGAGQVAVTVGSNLPHKNLLVLFTAMALIPPEQRPVLVLAGGGTDAPELATAAYAAGVLPDVRLAGYLQPADLEGLYAVAAGLVLPTRYEGFGLPVLEAFERGVPVACSGIAPLREVAGDAAVYFAPDRPEQIADAIIALLAEGPRRRTLIASGRARAQSFSWDAAAAATLDCYTRVVGGTRS